MLLNGEPLEKGADDFGDKMEKICTSRKGNDDAVLSFAKASGGKKMGDKKKNKKKKTGGSRDGVPRVRAGCWHTITVVVSQEAGGVATAIFLDGVGLLASGKMILFY